jgi:putative YpdA family bacillithiol system oxidoreductase
MPGYLSYAIVSAVIAFVVIVYWRRQYVAEVRSRHAHEAAAQAGLAEPVTLHPSLDPNRCISIGACAKACPEGDIIAMVNGHPQLIGPTKCIGHGECAAACPVDAITLVFGSATRGVDIPHVTGTFETNVSGIYIAGELGGMGLIRNAVTQGRQAIENIARKGSSDSAVLDVLIVGAGPAGLSASLQAHKQGLRYATIEQDDVGGAILSYPRQKIVMTQPMEIPLYGKFSRREITKEELLELWQEVIRTYGVEIKTGEKLESIGRQNNHFDVNTTSGAYAARNVLLAIGRRGTPRKLEVPGERLDKVAYKLLEPEQYASKKLLVVGGGDSAVEAALALADQSGSEVTLSYRKNAFSRIKDGNRDRVDQAITSSSLSVRLESQVREIRRSSVLIDHGGETSELPNDYTLVMIGGELPTALLRDVGVTVEKKFGEQ